MEKSLKVNGNLSAGSLMTSRGKAMVKGKNKVRGLSASEAFELSVVVPFRADPESPYLLPRLDDLCRHFPLRDDIEFIVVDSGSAPKSGKQCREICRRHKVRYLYHDGGQVFSLSDARNYGARYAKGRAICFFDVDVRTAADFWDRLFKFMSVESISRAKKSFLSTPWLFLTEKATKEFIADPKASFLDFCASLSNGKHSTMFKINYASTITVFNRLYYLSIGGHRSEFYGHGREENEFAVRSIVEEGVLPATDDFYKKTGGAFDARGSVHLSLIALNQPILSSNFFTVHLWHPRKGQWYSDANVEKNEFILRKFCKIFYKTGIHPPPLIDGAVKGKVLFIGDMRPNATHCLRDIFPLLGSPTCVTGGGFLGLFARTRFKSLLGKHKFDLILFHNPYENKVRLRLYKWCREKKLPLLCCGRGLLADSWFFDKNGYGADSKSYAEANWNKPLSAKEKKQTAEYIKKLRLKSALKKVKNFCAEVVGHPVDEKTLHRFIHFLRYNFYSFAVPRPSTVRAWVNRNLPRSAIQALDFYEIRLPDKPPIIYTKESRKLPRSSAAVLKRLKSERINRERIALKQMTFLQRIRSAIAMFVPRALRKQIRELELWLWFHYKYFTISRRRPPGA